MIIIIMIMIKLAEDWRIDTENDLYDTNHPRRSQPSLRWRRKMQIVEG